MLKIGCHLSSARGYEQMAKDALKVGANTFQFFTRNPRGGKAKDINEQDILRLLAISEEHHFGKLVAHAPYTLNCSGAAEKVRTFAYMVVADDLQRMEYLPGNYYNMHPGSHGGQGSEKGISMISELLNDILTPQQQTTVLLETMSGKGNEVGGRFEELAEIIRQVTLGDKMGVCMDLCHVHDAGYDIVNDLEGVLAEFDRIVGLEKLKAIHANDSRNPLGSRKDRHALIGEGFIGAEAIISAMNHPKLRGLPFILETPTDLEGHGKEIAFLKGKYR